MFDAIQSALLAELKNPRTILLCLETVALLVMWVWWRWDRRRLLTLVQSATGQGLVHGQRCRVARVIDGDTFKATLDGTETEVTVRVLGIDTPESKRNAKCRKDAEEQGVSVDDIVAKGKAAAKRGKALLLEKRVTLESTAQGEPLKQGGYGRWLAYVRLPDGRDYGRTLIKEGHANDFGWKYPHPRSDRYLRTRGPRRLWGWILAPGRWIMARFKGGK